MSWTNALYGPRRAPVIVHLRQNQSHAPWCEGPTFADDRYTKRLDRVTCRRCLEAHDRGHPGAPPLVLAPLPKGRPRPHGRQRSPHLNPALGREVHIASRLLDYDPILVIRFITFLIIECHWQALANLCTRAYDDYLTAHPDPDPPHLNTRQRSLLKQLLHRLDHDGYQAAQFGAALADDVQLHGLARTLADAVQAGLIDRD
jgi:hypothetical protein